MKLCIITEAQIDGASFFRFDGFWVFQSGDSTSKSTGLVFILSDDLYNSLYKWHPWSGRVALMQFKITLLQSCSINKISDIPLYIVES